MGMSQSMAPTKDTACLADRVLRERLTGLSMLSSDFRLGWYELRDTLAGLHGPVANAVAASLLDYVVGHAEAQGRQALVRGYYAIGAAIGVSEAEAWKMREELPLLEDHRRGAVTTEGRLEHWVAQRIRHPGLPSRYRSGRKRGAAQSKVASSG